jgi:branched-chain amino acid transport system substrate-binding protein
MQSRNILRQRRTVAAAILATGALIITGCAPSGSLSEDPSKGGDADTFTVGMLAPMTGFVSAIGTDMKQGWDLYWEENGTTAGKFTIKTVLEDDASSAETALTKANRLVTEEKVDVVVGPVLANQALAVADYLDQQGVANLSQTSADDVTQRESSPYVLRTGAMGGSHHTFAGGQWAYEQGHRSAATLCVDYAFGWETCGGFVKAFTDAGGTVEQQLWYPGDATDLSTYVTQLLNSGVDLIYAGTAGGTDSSNFLRSASDFGLMDKYPLLTNCCTLDQAILQDVGDIALGVKSVSYYAEGSKQAQEFVEAFEAKYGIIPSSYALGAYATAQLLAATLSGVDEKLTGEDLIDAIKAADLSGSPWGDISFDDYNSMVGPVMIREVEKRADGKLWNAVVQQYEGVSQFWTFDPEDYMKNPSFSPSYTGK